MIDEQHKFKAQLEFQSLISTGCIVFGVSVIAILVHANFFHVAPFNKAEVKHVPAPVVKVVNEPVLTMPEPVAASAVQSGPISEVQIASTAPVQIKEVKIEDIKPVKTIAVKAPVKNIPAVRNEVSHKKLCDEGDTFHCLKYGILLENQGSLSEAQTVYKDLCVNGYSDACTYHKNSGYDLNRLSNDNETNRVPAAQVEVAPLDPTVEPTEQNPYAEENTVDPGTNP